MLDEDWEGWIVDSEHAGLLAVSIFFGAIAVIEGVVISPAFYSMAGIILAMLGYFVLSGRLGRKEPARQGAHLGDKMAES